MDIIAASVFLFIGWSVIFLSQIALIFIGRPNKAGVHPRFLQFESSMILYPPLVLVFLAGGAAALIAGILGIAH